MKGADVCGGVVAHKLLGQCGFSSPTIYPPNLVHAGSGSWGDS